MMHRVGLFIYNVIMDRKLVFIVGSFCGGACDGGGN